MNTLIGKNKRLSKTEWSKVFQRYLTGEPLPQIHCDFKDRITLGAMQLYASRHNWSTLKKSMKIELENQVYKKVVVETTQQMTESKQKRIKMTDSFMDMLSEHSKSDVLLAPKQLAILANAFSVIAEIQRTEYGEASTITQSNNMNLNYSVDAKRKQVADLEAELSQYLDK